MIGSIGSTSSLFGQVDFSAMRQQREAKMFQEMDADGSGSVSKDEFSSWDKKMREQMPQMGNAGGMPSAEDIFTAVDSDQDGALSQNELSSMGEKMRALREAQMFKEVDADGNGTVSKDEFASWQDKIQARMSEMTGAGQMPSADDIFSKADSDGDGSLSKTEFSAMGKMGGPPPGPPPGGSAGESEDETESSLTTILDALGKPTEKFDTNGDGKVSIEELMAGLRSYTDSLSQYLQSDNSTSLDLVA